MATKKYLYKKGSGDGSAMFPRCNKSLPPGAQISAALLAGTPHCVQLTVDEAAKDDLDEHMLSHCYTYHGEIAGNDVVAIGAIADIPSYSEVPAGFQYYSTDENRIYVAAAAGWYYVALTAVS